MSENTVNIEISIGRQSLRLQRGAELLAEYAISTAKKGPGEQMDSECTPRGLHEICEKIGAGCPANTVFVGRRPTGELYTPELRAEFPSRDWILTRILWLAGLDVGCNAGGTVDSRWRYIYLHGTPDDVTLGVPGSRGCIRMRNADIMDLFDVVEVGTRVVILDDRQPCYVAELAGSGLAMEPPT
jgi:L,D-transpeptidase YbiS